MESMEHCIFCRIVRGEAPCFKIFENDVVLAFGDINPISEGHTLVIPKRHAENLWEIPGEDLSAVHLASQKVAHAIRKALKPSGIAVVQLNGVGANQVVMHYHIHLMPRGSEAPPLPVTNWGLNPGKMEGIRKTAEVIRAALEPYSSSSTFQ